MTRLSQRPGAGTAGESRPQAEHELRRPTEDEDAVRWGEAPRDVKDGEHLRARLGPGTRKARRSGPSSTRACDTARPSRFSSG
jgi:hypothetical protein